MTLRMTHHAPANHRSHPLLLASTLLVAVGCILLTSCTPTSAEQPEAPRRATLSGTTVCLPHRDQSGPHTMECAFGLQTSDSTRYALDLSVLQTSELFDLPVNQPLTVEGTLVPLDDIEQQLWKTYDISGQLRVSSIRHEA